MSWAASAPSSASEPESRGPGWRGREDDLRPAWSRNLTRKITRHPKVYVAGSGLAAYLLGKDPSALARPTDPARGLLTETFVVNEILRRASWLDQEVRLHHLRDRGGAEIDLVVEAADGRVVAIEV